MDDEERMRERADILFGLVVGLANDELLLSVVRSAESSDEALSKVVSVPVAVPPTLVDRYGSAPRFLSRAQGMAWLDMRSARRSKSERRRLEDELSSLLATR